MTSDAGMDGEQRTGRLWVVVRARRAVWHHERAVVVQLRIDGIPVVGWLLFDEHGTAHRLAEYRFGVAYGPRTTPKSGADPSSTE